jgi:hypothetical protein
MLSDRCGDCRFISFRQKRVLTALVFIIFSAHFLSAQTRTLRIATYNIEADISGVTMPLPGLIAPYNNSSAVQLGGSVEGIGEEIVGNDGAQPLDILALEETSANMVTVQPIVNGMNTFYNAPGMYTNSSYQPIIIGSNSGNGPNAVVYNTLTVQLLASHPVDPVGGTGSLGSSSGEYREVMRYEFAPAGVAPDPTNEFYIYVSHYKSSASGTEATNEFYRAEEAAIIRTNEATDLPATARVLYVGDYNVDNSGEAGYQTILSNAVPNSTKRQGGGIDPLNVTNNLNINWSSTTSNTNILLMLSEHSYNLEYRDDLQVMTSNVYYGAPGGFSYVPGTYHTFGNNGTVAYNGKVVNTSNTALNNNLVTNGPVFINNTTLYHDLTNASDHLPVVADYTIPMPAPVIASVSPIGNNLLLNISSGITGAVYTVLSSTNIITPSWTPIATNVSPGVNFALILTNAFSSAAPPSFYLLQGP